MKNREMDTVLCSCFVYVLLEYFNVLNNSVHVHTVQVTTPIN